MTTEPLSFRRLFFLLCMIWMALNLSVLLGHKVLPWDAMDEFYPTVYFNAHNLRLGLAPWWNPHIYGGAPAIGDPQGMLFSPLLIAWMLLRQSPSPLWFDWGVLLHLLMGGTAMLAALRQYRANALGCLIGATVFMVGGVAAARLEHTPDVLAYAYAPVVMLALHWFIVAPSLKRACLFGLAAGAMATHLVQVTYLFILLFASLAIVATWCRWASYTRKERLLWVGGMLLASMVAIVIAAPQLLFSCAFMAISNRSVVPLAAARAASLDWRAFLIMFSPNVFGSFRRDYDSYTGPADFVESFLYIGILPLLSLLLLSRTWKLPVYRWPLGFLAVVGVAATLYMLGTSTPFYPWLYTWLPGLTHLRRPADAAYVLNFVFAVVTGLCASRIKLHSRRELSLLLGVSLVWLTINAVQMHDHQPQAFFAVAAAAMALWQLRRQLAELRVILWLLIVLVADYKCYNLNGHFNEAHDSVIEFTHGKAAQYLSEHLAGAAGELPYRLTTDHTDVVWDNGVSLLGLASTQGYNPLRLALYEQWYQPHESSSVLAPDNLLNTAPTYTLDRLLSARFVVTAHRKDLPSYTPPESYVHVFGDEDVDIWRNDSVYPRVLNPRQVLQLRVNERPAAATFAATDFRQTLWLTPRDAGDAEGDLAVSAACTGKVTAVAQATLTQTKMNIHAMGSGWLVLNDLDAPGWRATIDGKDIPIHRANGLFRAVCVPTGKHRLVFSFHPWLMVADALWPSSVSHSGKPIE